MAFTKQLQLTDIQCDSASLWCRTEMCLKLTLHSSSVRSADFASSPIRDHKAIVLRYFLSETCVPV